MFYKLPGLQRVQVTINAASKIAVSFGCCFALLPIQQTSVMKFPVGYALSFDYRYTAIDFFVQGEPEGELCITCPHTIFHLRFNGGTKCFHPFTDAPFVPDETDEHYQFFFDMKATILTAWGELQSVAT
jgi:hypothetical protein